MLSLLNKTGFCVLLASLFGFTGALAQSPEPIRVGVSVPLTGNLAHIGITVKNSILLASKENDPSHRIEFLFEDDSYLPRNTVTAVNKFLNVDKVKGLIIFGSGGGMAVSELAERHKIPMIALATAINMTEGKQYVFRHLLDAERESMKVVAEVERRKYQSVAIVCTLQDGMLALRDAFLKKAKVNVVLNQEVLPDEISFRAIATQVKQKSPDAVYLLLLPPNLAYFVRQLHELGYSGQLFSAHQAEDRAEFKAASGTLKGVWYVNTDDSRAADFYARYEAAFHAEPANTAVNAYDVAKLMIRGIESGAAPKYLKAVKGFEGVIGTYNASGGNDFDLPVAVKVITETGFGFPK
jgi:branched-chain amino acid transport system substrate-binding protein